MIALSFLALLSALGAQRPSARPASDTTIPPETVARVTFDVGSGASAPLVVHDFDAGFAPSASAANNNGAVRMHFVKLPDALTPELARRGTSADRIPSVTIEVAAAGKPLMTFRLTDALVASDRLAIDEGGAALEQERLALEDAIAQVSADLLDAQRQLALTDALDKKKLSSTQEVARARDRVQLLETKLDVQKKRLRLLDRQIASHWDVKEEVTLVVTKFEVQVASN